MPHTSGEARLNVPEDLRYTKNHEWVGVDDTGMVSVGVTDFAQDALGDVVYVDLPDLDRSVAAGESFAEIESTKSVNDVYAPVAGTVVAVNDALMDTPELVNADPYGDGWFARIDPGAEPDLSSLMDAAAYRALIEAE